MDYAMESDINVFDTAQMYGFGESEEIVARGCWKNPDKRAYVSTKIGYLHDRTVSRMRGMEAYTNITEIRRCVKHSLWISRHDCIDMLLIHEADQPYWEIDYKTGDSVILSVLEDLKKEGLVANIGIGVCSYDSAAVLIDTGRIDVALVAGGITLLARPIFDKLIPAAIKHNTGIMVGAVFGQNYKYLTRKCKEDLPALLNSEDQQEVVVGKRLEEIYALADELDMDLFEMALRYVLAFDSIHTNVAGAREMAHVRANLAYIEKGPLEKDIVTKINQIQDSFIADEASVFRLFGVPQGFIGD